MDLGIDMRKELDSLLDNIGIHVLYLMKSQYIRCKCYNPLHQIGDPKCPYCGGSGRVVTGEMVKTITHSVNLFYEIGMNQNMEIGNVYGDVQSFYIKHIYKPAIRDIICICKLDNKNMPIDIIKVYEITALDVYRCDNGRVEYNLVAGKAKPDMKQNIKNVLKNLNKVVHLKGRTFLCPQIR